jgi:hypothetical protein
MRDNAKPVSYPGEIQAAIVDSPCLVVITDVFSLLDGPIATGYLSAEQ